MVLMRFLVGMVTKIRSNKYFEASLSLSLMRVIAAGERN